MTALPASRHLRLVRAANPGPMTLDGTNTWIVGDPTAGPPVVVDPGPRLPEHEEAVLAATGGRVGGIVLTHRHLDHAEAAPDLARRAGCPVRAADPAWQVGPDGLPDGAEWAVAGVRLRVVATPGHTADSCSLLVATPDDGVWLLTGDTVLGRGSTVIARPDGDLRAYLASLHTLAGLVETAGVRGLLPGHGPVVTDPAGWLADYRRHREERLDQIRAALDAGAVSAADVVHRVYADVPPDLRHAAEQSVQAQLDYLRGDAG